jgi:hypothetical protein
MPRPKKASLAPFAEVHNAHGHEDIETIVPAILCAVLHE